MKTTTPSSTADTARAIRVLKFSFTGYPVTDKVRARAFYEEVFHCKSSPQDARPSLRSGPVSG